jgi:oligopeptide transport system substrate-binding protein
VVTQTPPLGSTTVTSTTPSRPPSPITPSSPLPSTPPPNRAPGGQGTLNLADTGPITLDPATASETSSAFYIVQIYSGLLRLDQNLNLVPDIALSWDKSTDGKTYTFHLRRDAEFHDGTGVKASDFRYSWERALNPMTQSQTAGTYLNDIVGAADIISGKTESLSGVKIIDDYNLQVTIDAPKAYFLDKMAYPTAFVVKQANVQSGSQWWQHPIGTGPFKLKSWQQDQSLVLQRNDAFYGDRARVNEVDFQLFSGDPVQLYQSGTVDVASVASAYIGLVTDPSNPVSKELSVYSLLSFSYLGFNASVPPFDDVNVRRAFCYAVDKSKIMTLATNGVVTPAYGILPPGMPGYNSSLQGLSFDAAKAKQLLAASKYGNVSQFPQVVLTTSGWGGNISGIEGGIINNWKNILGVTVTVRQLEPEFYLYALNQEKNQLYDDGWVADYPDPQDFLDVLFHTGSAYNTGGYSNPQVDALLGQAAVEQNSASRMKMYQDAEQMIVNDAAVLPLAFDREYILVKPNVKGYILSPLGYPLLNLVSVQ